MSTKRDRLGKGLGALLGEYLAPEPSAGAAAQMVPVARIVPNPFQPRREFAEEELADLAASIRENGLLQPIVVRPIGEAGADRRYELVAGERRWRAVTRLAWTEVPATVRDIDDRTMLVLALVENLQRAGLSPLEEAEGYKRLVEDFSYSHQQVAEAMGRDRSTVANALRLLHLPPSVRRMVESGTLSAGHARALLGLGDERRIADLARRAVAGEWSVREVESQVQRLRGAVKSRPAAQVREAAERRLEEELQRALGTQVRLRRGRGGKGSIEIPFLSPDDFDRLYEMLTGTAVADVVS